MNMTNKQLTANTCAEKIVHLLGVGHVNDINHYIEDALWSVEQDVIGSILRIRCIKHLDVAQQNKNEHSGGECGGCIAQERDEIMEALSALYRLIETGDLVRDISRDTRVTQTIQRCAALVQ